MTNNALLPALMLLASAGAFGQRGLPPKEVTQITHLMMKKR